MEMLEDKVEKKRKLPFYHRQIQMRNVPTDNNYYKNRQCTVRYQHNIYVQKINYGRF